MEIALKNISYSERLSEETNCFSATIYIDGKKAGEASNHGHGGPTMIRPRELEQKIDAYAKTLTPRPFRHSMCMASPWKWTPNCSSATFSPLT